MVHPENGISRIGNPIGLDSIQCNLGADQPDAGSIQPAGIFNNRAGLYTRFCSPLRYFNPAVVDRAGFFTGAAEFLSFGVKPAVSHTGFRINCRNIV